MIPKYNVVCPIRNLEAEQTNPADDLVILCNKNCAWYNKEDDECAVLTFATNTKYLRQTLENFDDIINR